MAIPKVCTLDCETDTIKRRPDYPPKIVGMVIDEPGKRCKYMCWGHPTGNNCTKTDVKRELKRIYKQYQLLFHHAKFDLECIHDEFGLPLIPPKGFHDTEVLAFLHDPHAENLALKPLAEWHLDMPAEEQDMLHDWIYNNIYLSRPFKYGDYRIHIGAEKPKGYVRVPKTKLGAFIAYAPGKLVGKYGIGDGVRTTRLFRLFYRDVIIDRSMGDAYRRELRLMPTLMKNERQGVKINQRTLSKEVKTRDKDMEQVDNWLRKKLKNDNVNIDSNEELADALDNAGFIGDWVLTDKGNRSVSKDNLPLAVTNKDIVNVLAYRSALNIILGTFAKPWLKMAKVNNGFIHCDWSQTRNTDDSGKSAGGARTGRIQSSPNFQNIPKKAKFMPLPKALINKLSSTDLPPMRSFIVPDSKDHVFGHRDYSQQELRILAHFEDGFLLEEYNMNPNMDLHAKATELVNETLMANFDRDSQIKAMGFGLIYGMGLAKLGQSMEVDTKTAKTLKNAYLDIFPGLRELMDTLETYAKNDEPLTTWGGRQYYCEEPAFVKKFGRVQTFEYKMLNYLIQGSAADCTKEAIIRVDEVCKHSRMLTTVHDEINMSIPKECFWSEMKLMREAMESVEFDVPMLTDGGMSAKSWQSVKKFTDTQIKRYQI